MNEKKVIKKCEKPNLLFTCDMCKSEWEDPRWYLATEPKQGHMIGFMTLGNEREYPTSRCPVCGVESRDCLKTKKEESKEVL